MWWVFDRIPPAGRFIGAVFAFPAGFVEAIVVLVLIVRIERLFRGGESVRGELNTRN